jgi:hypothetical protein
MVVLSSLTLVFVVLLVTACRSLPTVMTGQVPVFKDWASLLAGQTGITLTLRDARLGADCAADACLDASPARRTLERRVQRQSVTLAPELLAAAPVTGEASSVFLNTRPAHAAVWLDMDPILLCQKGFCIDGLAVVYVVCHIVQDLSHRWDLDKQAREDYGDLGAN